MLEASSVPLPDHVCKVTKLVHKFQRVMLRWRYVLQGKTNYGIKLVTRGLYSLGENIA